MSPPPPALLLGTGNPGKLLELRALFGSLGLPLRSPADLSLDLEIREIGESYEANARLKSLAYAQAGGLWAIADDTGLEVEALDGAPGLRSARLAGPAGTDGDRRRKLLEMLTDEPKPWRARFVCTMALAAPTEVLALTTGECAGHIIPQGQGSGGFGYDSIFLIAGDDRTMAQLSMEEKNRVSHRARAARAMGPLLEDLLQDASEVERG